MKKLIIIIPLLMMFCGGENSSEDDIPVKAVFIYEFPVDQEAEFAVMKKLSINRLYLSISDAYIDSTLSEKESFFALAKKNNISVHAMTLENTKYLFPENFAAALKMIDDLLKFRVNGDDPAFDGINIDAEPHAIFSGQSPYTADELSYNTTLMSNYLMLLELIHDRMKKYPDVEFSSDIAWWYNEKAVDGIIAEGATAKLSKWTTHLIPMVYDGIGSNSQDIIKRVTDEIEISPIVIGIGVKEFADYSSLEKTIKELNNHFEDSKNYKGVVIFKYSDYVKMSGGK